MKQILLNLEDSQGETLDRYKKEIGISYQEFIRRAIDHYGEKLEEEKRIIAGAKAQKEGENGKKN